jgi:DASH complex subunit Spc34
MSRSYYRARKNCVRRSEYPYSARSPCAKMISPVAGATEKIASLRNRYRQIGESVALHGEKVSKQQSKLERMNKSSDFSQSQDEEEDYGKGGAHQAAEPTVTEEDLRLEEQEIKELELKKRTLEERVTGMEKDLGGLLR